MCCKPATCHFANKWISSGIFLKDFEHKCRTLFLRNNSWWLLPKGYLTERFSADTFKEEGTIDIFPIWYRFTKQAATFSNNLISRHFQWLLHFTIVVEQLLNTSELKSHFSELFEWSCITRKKPIKLCLKEKLFKILSKKLEKCLWKSSWNAWVHWTPL